MVTGSYVLSQVKEYEYIFKVALIGDSSVGKTCIVKRFTEYKFPSHSRETIGIDFVTKTITVDGHKCKLCIWDTAGQERYRSMSKSYYRGLDGALVVYDISRASSFTSTQSWLKSLNENSPEETAICLIGNKTDKENVREVSTNEGSQMAEGHSILFTEASALNGEHIEDCFQLIVRQIIQRRNLDKERMKANKKEFNFSEKRFSHVSIPTSATDSSTIDFALTREPINLKKKKKNSCGC